MQKSKISILVSDSAHKYILITLHSKKSLLIVKLRSFQNASIEIKQIYFAYQQSRFAVKKLICKMQNENIFTD